MLGRNVYLEFNDWNEICNCLNLFPPSASDYGLRNSHEILGLSSEVIKWDTMGWLCK
jgi:hypothetical protein